MNPSIGEQLYEDPDAAVERFRQEQRQERAQERAVEKFYDDFFASNPDLGTSQTKRLIVGSVLQENLSRWANLPTSEASKKLAEAVRREMKEAAAPYKEVEPSRRTDTRSRDDADREILVGGLDHGSPMTEGVPAPTKSLGSTILARRAARREKTPGVRVRGDE